MAWEGKRKGGKRTYATVQVIKEGKKKIKEGNEPTTVIKEGNEPNLQACRREQ